MANSHDQLEDLLKAKEAEIAELKRRLFGASAPAVVPAVSGHSVERNKETNLKDETAHSPGVELGGPANLQARRTPPSSLSRKAGTQDDPFEISDSDEDAQDSTSPKSASMGAPSHRNPGSRGTSRSIADTLDIIELSDSESAHSTEEPVTRKTRKRRHEPVSPEAATELRSTVKSEESPVLSATSRRKQRKLNHAASHSVERDVKPPSHSGVPVATAKIELQESTRQLLRNTFSEGGAKKEEDTVLPSEAPQAPADVDSPEPLKPEDEPILPAALDDEELARVRRGITRLANPKAEIKKEYQLKDEDLLQLHLPHLDALQPYPIALPEDQRSITVRRELLAKRYGGSSMDTFPSPSAEKRAEHGRANLMCINLLWNPHAPQVPGHAGLYFDMTLPGDTWTGWKGHSARQTLFVKLKAGKWLYLGEYEANDASSLTAQQWRGLAESVRATWTKNISEKDWGKTIRARIHLRRTLGREPTRGEVINAEGLFKNVTREQVSEAMAAGFERVHAWSMKCIGYDEDFQREVIQLSRGEL